MRELAELTREWTTSGLLAALHEAGVLAEKVQSYGEWLEDGHVLARQAYRWVDAGSLGPLPLVSLPGLSELGADQVRAPGVGDDSISVCRRFGMDEPAIERFHRDGAFGPARCSGR